MVFNNFSFSQFSNAKLSFHFNKLFQFPLTLITPFQSHQMNNNHAIGRIFEQYSFALSNDIKPVSPPPSNNCIHTRLGTGHGRLMQMRETLDRAKYELEAVRSRQQLQMQEALTFEKTVQTLTSERDRTQALLAHEKELVEDAERLRKVVISSLRQRFQHEKALLLKEVEELQETVRNKDENIAELTEFCMESVQKAEAQDHQIAVLESSEAMESFSRKVSCSLYEMREVVLLRPEKGESLDDKMRDLHDGIKDLVREVKSRRQHSHKMTERIFSLEEERLMWSRVE